MPYVIIGSRGHAITTGVPSIMEPHRGLATVWGLVDVPDRPYVIKRRVQGAGR